MKLTKDKRDRLILVSLVIGIVMAGLWFGLIKFQQSRLRMLETRKRTAELKYKEVENAIKNRGQLQAEVNSTDQNLSALEENMASGDPYSWMFNTIRQFKLSYKVDIPQFSTIVAADTTMFPKFPYKQVTMSVNGTAYFHDLGRFIADFENHFPQIRIQNLDIEPGSSLTSTDREKLSFKMDIVALIKSGT